MTDKFEPLRLRGLTGDIHEIDSVTGALGFVYGLWPRRAADKRIAAEQACRQALAGDISPDKARQALLEAASEADIVVPAQIAGN